MLGSALDHYRRQQRIQARGIESARKARRRGLAQVSLTVARFQMAAAQDALYGIEEMLAEQRLDAPPLATVSVSALAGTASDGRPLATLFNQAETDYQFGLMVATQLKDVARMAAGTSMATRPGVGGYTRMLNPPSCSRCAVMAGKFYRWNTGFQRHPRCDCIHVPAASQAAAEAAGTVTDPNEYFESLPTAEALDLQYPELTVKMRNEGRIYSQEDIFTKAGAQAIRDGADVSQVVNARRGMNTAQVNTAGWSPKGRLEPTRVFGRDAYVTNEGMSRRGLAYERLNTRFESNGARRGTATTTRLMPETLYSAATDRDDAIRLLKLHGFIH